MRLAAAMIVGLMAFAPVTSEAFPIVAPVDNKLCANLHELFPQTGQ